MFFKLRHSQFPKNTEGELDAATVMRSKFLLLQKEKEAHFRAPTHVPEPDPLLKFFAFKPVVCFSETGNDYTDGAARAERDAASRG